MLLFLLIDLVCIIIVLFFDCRKQEDADRLMDRMQELADIKVDVDQVLNENIPEQDDEEMAKLETELDMAMLGDLPKQETSALPSVPSKKPSTTTPVKSRSIPASTAEEELEAQLNDL